NMANTDNKCSHLEGEDFYSKSNTHLKDMLDLQAKTQDMYFEKQGKPKFENMSLQELSNFFLLNKHSIEDEFSEMMDALGGINDGIGNAVWKPWKGNYSKTPNMKISDLSLNDQKELKMEIIDAWHFLMNFWIAVGGTPEEFYNFYMIK